MNRLESLWESHFKFFIVISYWLLGLCNNFAYVIMLSAAHDILSPSESNSTNVTFTSSLDNYNYYSTANKTNKYDCNDLSTGTILLADILPGIIIKLIAPFFVHKIKYWQRVLIVVIINSCSYLLVALSPSEYKWLIFVGVGCASLSSSFGEITFLSLSTFYDRNLSLGGWGSGTGAAGLIGSFGYAGLTSLGMKPRTTILSMLFMPFLMGFSYVIMPPAKPTINSLNVKQTEDEEKANEQEKTSLLRNNPVYETTISDEENNTIKEFLKNKLKLIQPLLKYMIPLFLVYFSEYFINQGLFELLYFKDSFIKDHKLQYRWYNVVYQLAVFISRSSIGYIKIRYLYIFPVFQLLNVGVAFSQIFSDWMPSIWIAFVLIFWEGLLGGGCYVNAFDLLSVEIDKKDREASIAIASIADSIGIALAGFTSIPVHNAICEFGSR